MVKNASKSKTPAPCSVIERFLSFFAVRIIAYFTNAVFYIFLLIAWSSKAESVSAIDAEMMEALTLVPEFTMHSLSLWIPSPSI